MSGRSLKKIIDRILNPDGSVSIDDPEIIRNFTDDPDFPYLVSFSRTGSHWLRMVMELYFEKPALTRAFYFKDAVDFTCYHTHDMELELRRENVIYLYRDPVETVYSQLCYYKEDSDDAVSRQHWTNLYARHLAKWLVHDDFTRKKTVITYEGMKSDMHREMGKICNHLSAAFDAARLDSVLAQVSKEELKRKTRHDAQVVDLSNKYRDGRDSFMLKFGDAIREEVLSAECRLDDFLFLRRSAE